VSQLEQRTQAQNEGVEASAELTEASHLTKKGSAGLPGSFCLLLWGEGPFHGAEVDARLINGLVAQLK